MTLVLNSDRFAQVAADLRDIGDRLARVKDRLDAIERDLADMRERSRKPALLVARRLAVYRSEESRLKERAALPRIRGRAFSG